MATVNLKYSWFLNQKGTKRLKRMRLKYWNKFENVSRIRQNADIYGIELPEDTKQMIRDKKEFYSKQITKLNSFEWSYNKSGKDEALKYIEKLFTKEEVSKYKTEGGILKTLRKLF